MTTLINTRRLALIAAVLVGSFVGSLAAASPGAKIAQEASTSRQCTSTFCTNLIWLRAPVLRTVHVR